MVDNGIDDDSDGFWDWLSVVVEIDVIQSKIYNVFASLSTDPNSQSFMFERGQSELPDSNSIEVLFDGRVIRKTGIDKPFTISVSLYDPNSNYITSQDFTSAAYTAEMFEIPPIEFKANYSDYAVSTDGDCVLDLLIIDLEVQVNEPNRYDIDGWLYDNIGEVIDIVSISFDPNIGSNTISLQFSGKDIADHGVDGPYYLNYVAIRQQTDSGDGYLTAVENVHTTASYLAEDFDPGINYLLGDFNCDGNVRLEDFAIFSKAWQSFQGQPEWNPLCNLYDSDSVIDIFDLTVLAQLWLEGTSL